MRGSPLFCENFCWHIPGYFWDLQEPRSLPAATRLSALRSVRVVTTSRSLDMCAVAPCSVRAFADYPWHLHEPRHRPQRVWQPFDRRASTHVRGSPLFPWISLGPSRASTPSSSNASAAFREGCYNIQKRGHACGNPLFRASFCWQLLAATCLTAFRSVSFCWCKKAAVRGKPVAP